jgi:hypothetical protein
MHEDDGLNSDLKKSQSGSLMFSNDPDIPQVLTDPEPPQPMENDS